MCEHYESDHLRRRQREGNEERGRGRSLRGQVHLLCVSLPRPTLLEFRTCRDCANFMRALPTRDAPRLICPGRIVAALHGRRRGRKVANNIMLLPPPSTSHPCVVSTRPAPAPPSPGAVSTGFHKKAVFGQSTRTETVLHQLWEAHHRSY